MLYDLAVDDVFDYLAGDSCKGDGPVVSEVVSVVIIVHWCDMCLFPHTPLPPHFILFPHFLLVMSNVGRPTSDCHVLYAQSGDSSRQ